MINELIEKIKSHFRYAIGKKFISGGQEFPKHCEAIKAALKEIQQLGEDYFISIRRQKYSFTQKDIANIIFKKGKFYVSIARIRKVNIQNLIDNGRISVPESWDIKILNNENDKFRVAVNDIDLLSSFLDQLCNEVYQEKEIVAEVRILADGP